MPELPDVNLYVQRLHERLVGERLEAAKLSSPFVLRSVGVGPKDLVGLDVLDVGRLGKRIVISLSEEHFILIHLMIAGRFVWKEHREDAVAKRSKVELASFVWSSGTLVLNEASQKKRAGIWLLHGRDSLSQHLREGLDVLNAGVEQFSERVAASERTIKRTLTDPDIFDGIGNAYSDEILFWAKLSPLRRAKALTSEEARNLYETARKVLTDWNGILLKRYPNFPKPSEITAFRKEFAVHGKFGQPCPVCSAPIQKVVYAENEFNYCARCQTEGKVLADRSLSRLLKGDWPKNIDELISEA